MAITWNGECGGSHCQHPQTNQHAPSIHAPVALLGDDLAGRMGRVSRPACLPPVRRPFLQCPLPDPQHPHRLRLRAGPCGLHGPPPTMGKRRTLAQRFAVALFRLLAAIHAVYYLAEIAHTKLVEYEPVLAVHHVVALVIFLVMAIRTEYIMVLSIVPYWLHALYHVAGSWESEFARRVLPVYCLSLATGGLWATSMWLKGVGTIILPLCCFLEVAVNYHMQCNGLWLAECLAGLAEV
ncbi:hypothetical protein DFJ77DRAFT_255868 [Powellomyces hirtus]|nr:hypothetical protein DFJ77DRAFT_283327 [Powellomyces hirtus]KAI8904223.1 hypothetical protein DFJ77DRAFT_255868 [Powellomyces hirtus]